MRRAKSEERIARIERSEKPRLETAAGGNMCMRGKSEKAGIISLGGSCEKVGKR